MVKYRRRLHEQLPLIYLIVTILSWGASLFLLEEEAFTINFFRNGGYSIGYALLSTLFATYFLVLSKRNHNKSVVLIYLLLFVHTILTLLYIVLNTMEGDFSYISNPAFIPLFFQLLLTVISYRNGVFHEIAKEYGDSSGMMMISFVLGKILIELSLEFYRVKDFYDTHSSGWTSDRINELLITATALGITLLISAVIIRFGRNVKPVLIVCVLLIMILKIDYIYIDYINRPNLNWDTEMSFSIVDFTFIVFVRMLMDYLIILLFVYLVDRVKNRIYYT